MIYNWPRLPREREENQLGHIPRPTRELYHTHYKAVGTTPLPDMIVCIHLKMGTSIPSLYSTTVGSECT